MIIISVGSGGFMREFFRLNSNSNEMNIISRLILITQKNFSVVLVQLWKILFEFIYFGNIKSRAMSSVAKRWERVERWGKINEDNSASSPMKRHKFSQENCLYNYFKLSKVYHLKMRFLFTLCLCVLAHPLLHTIYDFLNFKITSLLFLSFIHFLFWSISGAFRLLFHEKIEFLVLFQFLLLSWVLLTPRLCLVCSLSTLCAYSLLKFNIRLNELSRKKFFSSFT